MSARTITVEAELPDESERLALPGSPHALVFHRKLTVRISRDEQGYRCEIPRLSVARAAETREKAVAAVTAALREETAALLGTLSHELEDEELERKRVLLGNVDVLRSGLARNVSAYAWVLGRVEVDQEGHPWFRAVGSRGERFSFSPGLSEAIPRDRFVRMARVRAGSVGEPIGPVVELERPLGVHPEQVWAEVERRLTPA